MKLKTQEIIDIGAMYINLCKDGYYNRKYSISRIYDHFFAKLYFRLSKKSNDISFQSSFSKNINLCSNESFETLEIGKPFLDFPIRKIGIPNLYDIIMYEALTQKLHKEINKIVISSDDLDKNLLEKKYFGYAHRINLKSEDIRYEHYLDGWLKYNNLKNQLINENSFYLETDIKGFYDNIEHDNFIKLLLRFFHEKLNSSENLDYINDILYSLNNVFYKVSGFKKKGLPQGLLSSDILSQIYLWLIFYFEDSIRLENSNASLKGTGAKLLLYADDIIIISTGEKNLYKGFIFLKNVLEKYGLSFNASKTSGIKKGLNPNDKDNLNIEMISKNDLSEIKKLIDRILIILTDDINNLPEGELKTIFKWFGKINLLDKNIKDLFLAELIKKGIKFNKRSLEDSKKISLLLIISPSNFKHLLLLLNQYYKEKIKNVDFQKIFISNYLTESDLYVPLSNLIFLYLDLGASLSGIGEFIKEKVLSSGNHSLIDLLDGEKRYLKSNLLKNKLYGLYNLIYKEVEDGIDYSENIIGVKLTSIFDIDIRVTVKLSEMLRVLVTKKIIDLETLEKLSNILDDLLLNKMTHKVFYLKNPSFLADLYSMFNILLSLLHSIEIQEIEKVKIGGTIGVINNYETSNLIIMKPAMSKIVKRYENLLYFVTKNRARYNHKETDVLMKENIEILALKHSNTFSLHIKSFILDTFKEINDNLELNYVI